MLTDGSVVIHVD